MALIHAPSVVANFPVSFPVSQRGAIKLAGNCLRVPLARPSSLLRNHHFRPGNFVRADGEERENAKAAPPAAAANAPDPLKTTDYLWNVPWQKMLESDEQQAAKNRKLDEKEEVVEDGFLSLTRPSILNDINVDLSEELSRPSRATLQAEEIRRRNAELAEKEARRRSRYRYAPTRGELKEQEKKRAFFTGPYSRKEPSRGGFREISAEEEQLLAKRREDLNRYDKLKRELYLITLLVGASITAAMNVGCGADASISAGVGVLGSLMYLRLLSRAVDSLGASGLGGGPPRILVPVILMLGFTKWNQSFADDYNVHLQLFPMLGAFFSYKLATIIQGATSFFSSNEENASNE